MRAMPSPDSIVVGIDEGPASRAALRWACDEACRRHLPLHLLHAVQPMGRRPGLLPKDPGDDELADCLASATAQVGRRYPRIDVTWSQPHGSTVAALAHTSQRAALLVMGTRRFGRVRQVVLGSTVIELIAEADCPVVIVHGRPAGTDRGPVMVAIGDGSGDDDALEAALREATDRGCTLVAVHVTDADPLDQQWTRRILAELRSKGSEIPVEFRTTRGDPVDALVDHCDDARLLVLGSRGRRELGGALLGSVGQGAVRRMTCPILVVRPGTLRRWGRYSVAADGHGTTAGSEPLVVLRFPVADQIEHPTPKSLHRSRDERTDNPP